MSVTILSRQSYTAKDLLKSMEGGGKKRGRLAGGWIHDLCALKKVILLCGSCKPKMDPKKLGYRQEKDWPVVCGKCDGCFTDDWHCTAYFNEETYSEVRSTKDERRALHASREKRIKQGRL